MFDHLKGLDPTGKTAWVELPEIAGKDGVSQRARLKVKFCGITAVPDYTNASLKLSAAHPAEDNRSAEIDRDREDDRLLLPEHVIVGWDNVFDAQGNPAPFTPENAKKLLAALPNFLVDRIRGVAKTPANFLIPDPKAIAKN